jgi:5S rRNA maturation endonuclease (ribonuclease M5)
MNATTRIKPIHRLINRLKLNGLRSQKTASGFQAQCPAHDDQRESLSIGEGTDARVLLKCHAGCEVKAIVAALDLSLADLFENSVQTRGEVDSIYRYEDREGHDLFRVVRYRPKDFRVGRASASGDFEWGLGGVTPVLYHLPDILEAGKADERIFIVEGEKDVDSLFAVGLKATTNFGGAGKWRPSYSESLRNARVAIIPDNDETGRTHAQTVAAALTGVASEVKVVELAGLPVKSDVSDWLAADHTVDELNALVESTPLWTANSVGTEPSRLQEPEVESEEASQRPEVIASGRQLPAITQDALQALRTTNVPPELFARSGSMVSAVLDEAGRRIIRMVTEDGLRGRLARSGNYFRINKKGKVAVVPPIEVVKDILSLAPIKWDLPILEGVIETPVIREDGTLVQERGYDAVTHLYYEPALGLEFPKVPEVPSEADLRDSLALIDDVIGEFPFEDEASKANATALLLTPVLRHTIHGCIPLALIDAPQEGNGKSLFTEVVSLTSTGRKAPMRVAPYQDDEWRKALTSEFISGSPFIVIDNLESVLKSPALASAITSSIWSDRLLGKNERVEVPQRAVIVVTGNNVQLGGDFNRRSFWIRLNAKVSRPWQGREFRHPALLTFVEGNRGRILAALLTLVRHWYASGRPTAEAPILGSFEEWCRIVGGVLSNAGIRGFLGNLSALLERADQDRGEWQVFMEWLWEKRHDDVFRVADLIGNIKGLYETLPEGSPQGTEYLPSSLADKWDPSRIHPFQTALGRAMKKNVETRYGPHGIHLRSEKSLPGTGGVACYSIGFVDPPAPPIPLVGPVPPPPDDLEMEPPAPKLRGRGRRKAEPSPAPVASESLESGDLTTSEPSRDERSEPAAPERLGSGSSKTLEPS